MLKFQLFSPKTHIITGEVIFAKKNNEKIDLKII